MTPVQDAFLTLLRISLGSADAPPELTAEQWAMLVDLAQAHKLLPMLYEVCHLQLQQANPPLAAAARRRVRDQVILQTLRTAEFLELYRSLEQSGLTPLVVKGIVCRQLYPKPDHRPSSDEDVLIPPEQLARCRQMLEQNGLSTTEADPDAYEFPYCKAGSPLYIELHQQLFPPHSEAYGDLNRHFRHAFHRPEQIEAQGQQIRTLHPTDHMTYLIFHAFKHFLHSGFGIRQVCDILLFARNYDARIDWDHVRKSCRHIRAEQFAAAVFAIGGKHLGFEAVGGWPEVNELPLLEDVLQAGIYGSADETRLHSSAITLNAVSAQKHSRRMSSGLLVSAFPPARELEGRYPWLRGRPYLLPAAWGCRILGYLRQPGSAPADTLRVGAERVELLRLYGIVT